MPNIEKTTQNTKNKQIDFGASNQAPPPGFYPPPAPPPVTKHRAISPCLTEEYPLRPNRKIDITKAIELHQKGVGLPDIAKQFDCHKSAVYQVLKRYVPGLINVKAFNDNRPTLYAALEAKVLHSLSDEKIDEMTAPQAIREGERLQTMHRLETGQSTENIALLVDGSPAVVGAIKAASSDYLQRLSGENTGKPEESPDEKKGD